MKQGIRSLRIGALGVLILVAVASPTAAFQRGRASYYQRGDSGAGRTASGVMFDDRALTAAHRTLPFGTRVRVTCVRSHKSVEVTINDRGPFVTGRIVDLSRAAFLRLAPTERGVIDVRLEVIGPAPDGPNDDVSTPAPLMSTSHRVILEVTRRHLGRLQIHLQTPLSSDYRAILLEVASRLQRPVMRVPADVGPTLTVGQVVAFYHQHD